MSYLRMGSDSGLVDPDVIDLTNDPELLGGAGALNTKTSSAASKAADLFSAAKSFAAGAAGGAPKTASAAAPRRAPAIKKNVTIGQSAGSAPAGMRRGYLDTNAATVVRSAGISVKKTPWLLIGGAALVVGGIAFFAMRKRS